jgi:hypothetical protein
MIQVECEPKQQQILQIITSFTISNRKDPKSAKHGVNYDD